MEALHLLMRALAWGCLRGEQDDVSHAARAIQRMVGFPIFADGSARTLTDRLLPFFLWWQEASGCKDLSEVRRLARERAREEMDPAHSIEERMRGILTWTSLGGKADIAQEGLAVVMGEILGKRIEGRDLSEMLGDLMALSGSGLGTQEDWGDLRRDLAAWAQAHPVIRGLRQSMDVRAGGFED
jgi:hypothetical protein